MSKKLGVLVLTICFSLFAGTHLLFARCQTPKEPAETVKKFFEMLTKGEADGLETVFLLPADITDSEIRDLKMSLLDAANDLRRRGGIKSLTISPQRSVGERAEVRVEYTLADGTTKIDTLVLTYDNGEWKISTTLEPTQAANETGAITSLRTIAEGSDSLFGHQRTRQVYGSGDLGQREHDQFDVGFRREAGVPVFL
jgi:hypothetical protein